MKWLFILLLILPLPAHGEFVIRSDINPIPRYNASGGVSIPVNKTGEIEIPILMHLLDVLIFQVSFTSPDIVEQLTVSLNLKLDESYSKSVNPMEIHEGNLYQFEFDFLGYDKIQQSEYLVHNDTYSNTLLTKDRVLKLSFSSITPIDISVNYSYSVNHPPFFNGNLDTARYIFLTSLIPLKLNVPIIAGYGNAKLYLILPIQILDFALNDASVNNHISIKASFATTTPIDLIAFTSDFSTIESCDTNTFCTNIEIGNQYVLSFNVEINSPLSSVQIEVNSVIIDSESQYNQSQYDYFFARNQFLMLLIILAFTSSYWLTARVGNRKMKELQNKKDSRLYAYEIRYEERYVR